MKLRFGICQDLEEQANALLAESLAGVTSRKDKSDILTPWKEEDRKSREVYTSTGFADPAVRRGMYRRAWNPRYPHLNSRDGHFPARRVQGSIDNPGGDGEHVESDE